MGSQQNGSACRTGPRPPTAGTPAVYGRVQIQAHGLKSSAVASPCRSVSTHCRREARERMHACTAQSMTTTTVAIPLPLIQVLLPHLRGCWGW